MRERLIELVCEAKDLYPTIPLVNGCKPSFEVFVADHILANGGIVPPCKVGDIVWVANKSVGKAFFNKVVCIIFGASRNTNTIVVEYRNTYGETSRREFKWNQFGKQVFFSREEAEAALKGR